ncbi:MAG: hypothetical protein Q9227_003926 [Pyrenula ochraceoflavens]
MPPTTRSRVQDSRLTVRGGTTVVIMGSDSEPPPLTEELYMNELHIKKPPYLTNWCSNRWIVQHLRHQCRNWGIDASGYQPQLRSKLVLTEMGYKNLAADDSFVDTVSKYWKENIGSLQRLLDEDPETTTAWKKIDLIGELMRRECLTKLKRYVLPLEVFATMGKSVVCLGEVDADHCRPNDPSTNKVPSPVQSQTSVHSVTTATGQDATAGSIQASPPPHHEHATARPIPPADYTSVPKSTAARAQSPSQVRQAHPFPDLSLPTQIGSLFAATASAQHAAAGHTSVQSHQPMLQQNQPSLQNIQQPQQVQSPTHIQSPSDTQPPQSTHLPQNTHPPQNVHPSQHGHAPHYAPPSLQTSQPASHSHQQVLHGSQPPYQTRKETLGTGQFVAPLQTRLRQPPRPGRDRPTMSGALPPSSMPHHGQWSSTSQTPRRQSQARVEDPSNQPTNMQPLGTEERYGLYSPRPSQTPDPAQTVEPASDREEVSSFRSQSYSEQYVGRRSLLDAEQAERLKATIDYISEAGHAAQAELKKASQAMKQASELYEEHMEHQRTCLGWQLEFFQYFGSLLIGEDLRVAPPED